MTLLVAAMLACNMSSGDKDDITCYPGVTPGKTTRAELVALLGEPASSQTDGADETLLFATPYPFLSNTVILRDGVVAFVEVVLGETDALAFSSVTARYGQPTDMTFSGYQQGAMTYLYPDKGLAFIADEGLDIVYLKQCFVAMPLEDFMNSWGKDLPTQDPFTR